MKQALRQGTYATLNIYSQTNLADSTLGKCTLPSSVGGGGGGLVAASVCVNDGCNVQAGTTPNGAVADYNEGKAAVHETGHTGSGCCMSLRGVAAMAVAIALPIRPGRALAPMGVRRACLRIAVRGLRGWMRCIIAWVIALMRVIPCLRHCSSGR